MSNLRSTLTLLPYQRNLKRILTCEGRECEHLGYILVNAQLLHVPYTDISNRIGPLNVVALILLQSCKKCRSFTRGSAKIVIENDQNLTGLGNVL